jgi:23S rRNA (uridine2552-2'-O)-methyltransferase
MSNKKHSASSKRWLKEHFDDVYANEARKLGYRSRAYFKIEELDKKR